MTDEEKKDKDESTNGGAEPTAPLADLEAKLLEAQAASKRWQAEYVNYQQRASREREAERKYALEGLLREILPALDALGHTHQKLEAGGAAAPVVEAVRLAEREMLRVLGRYGVRRMEETPTFDPAVHEAIATVETTEQPEGAVVEVLQAGYLLHDRVLRAATVRVAKTPQK